MPAQDNTDTHLTKGDERIILFTRYPEPGKAKTRLIPAFGPEGACHLHRQMTEWAVKQIRNFYSLHPVSIEICFDGGNEVLMENWLGKDFYYSVQTSGDLGTRMENAFQKAFESGSTSVILIGSDCPALNPPILDQAFEGLKNHDLILGPTLDGGYYLIGLKKNRPLFDRIPWESDKVFSKTMEKARGLGLKIAVLAPLRDIDRPEDLGYWESLKDSASSPTPNLSIIIPTLNEAETVLPTLARIPQNRSNEVIVVDGGSYDGTKELAAAWGAKILSASRGRAKQMNAGAGQARGRFLLFLHADTLLPKGFSGHITRTLSNPGTAGGAFQLKLEPSLPGLKWIEKAANWRARVLQLPYGDQAIFLRKEQFLDLKGFREISIMEDVDLVRRLARVGKIGIVPVPVVSSSRRWKRSGIWRTTFKNQFALAAFWGGISPDRLARWYHGRSGEKS